MKRRFVVTLLAVAIATISASAFCRAPVISEILSPIIADDKPVTNSNSFVYPDAFNLDQKASDPDAAPAPGDIIWSYTGDGTYRINNRDPMNLLAGNDPNAPGTKEVGKTGLDDPVTGEGQDSNVRTITFRNAHLSPVGGPNTVVNTPGIIAAETKTVTLFASDGSTYTLKSFLVYTRKGGVDQLSGAAVPGTIIPVQTPLVPRQSQGWVHSDAIPGLNLPAFSESATDGLCLQSPLTNGGFGSWVSPYGIVPLVANNVYRIRVNVSTGSASAIAASVTPLWDIVLDNYSGVAAAKDQRYSCDWIFWDNNGAADSAGLASPSGRHVFDCWWAPMPVLLSDWNDTANANGPFNTANDAVNDGRLQFRFLDVDSSAVDGQNDAGTLCMTSYQIDRLAISGLTTVATPLNQTVFSASTNSLSMLNATVNPSATVSYAGGAATIAPASGTAWSSVEVANFDPGDTTVNYGPPTTLSDNWPIPWVSDQLLKYTIGIQAPDATGQSNPPDAIHMMIDNASTEVLADNMVLFTTSLVGGPKSAAVNDYVMLYYTHNKTLNATPQYAFLRTRFGILCRADLQTGSPPSATNPAGVKITYEKLEQINTAGF